MLFRSDRIAAQDALRDFIRSPADPSSLHMPVLVTAAALQHHVADLSASLTTAMKAGRKDFHAEVLRTKASTRGVIDFVGGDDMAASATSAQTFFDAAVPIPADVVKVTEASAGEVSPDLAGVLAPAMYGISPGETFCACERYHLGAVRWQEHGTRQVTCTPESAFLTFLRARSPGLVISFRNMWETFRTASADMMNAYAEAQGAGVLRTVTVSAGDALYIPPAWVVADKSIGGDSFGLRLSVLRTVDADVLKAVLDEFAHTEIGRAHV